MTDVKNPFPLALATPVEMYQPACQKCVYCQHVLRLPNVLFSQRTEWILVWIPKCACSTMRWLFLEFQKIQNPWAFKLTHTQISYHHLHRKQSYQYGTHMSTYGLPDSETYRILIVIRHPFRRLLSYFVQKHVFEKDFKFFPYFAVQEYRLWTDVHHSMYTLRDLIVYLKTHGCMDIHDCPMICQIPETFLSSPYVTFLDSDDVNFKRDVRHFIQRLPWLQVSTTRTFDEFKPLFESFPRLNQSPFQTNENVPSDFWNWTVQEWRLYSSFTSGLPSIEWFMNKWEQCQDKVFLSAFHSLYEKDLCLWKKTKMKVFQNSLKKGK